MRETHNLEFKETVTNTFLKTVSAFANYCTGEILFGISDDAQIIGIENPDKICLDIENRINDNIDPIPDYTLSINEKTKVITLKVSEGINKPYLYKSKAYKRNDSATIPVDRIELSRLILEGQNLSFEELTASDQNLTFNSLEKSLVKALNISGINTDTLKTLELYTDNSGYNKAAELLADKNNFPGIDVARFGNSISIILDRETYDNISIISQYEKALGIYKKYYQYEQIIGSTRETIALIPEEAYREAVANALVHRLWDIHTNINIAMFEDRIEITSPGGLPSDISEEDYLRGGISIPRNRIIGGVFFRLKMIERFGTGIRRINEAYRDSIIKPKYDITQNAIKITLPLFSLKNDLSQDEMKVCSFLKGKEVASSTIAQATGFGKSKTINILKKLVQRGYIKTTGNGRGLKYTC